MQVKQEKEVVTYGHDKYVFKCSVCRSEFERDMGAVVARWDEEANLARQYGLPPCSRMTFVSAAPEPDRPEEHEQLHYVSCWNVAHLCGLGGLPYSP